MATHDIEHNDHDNCELCDTLDALETAVRRYCAVTRCTCEQPMLGIMLGGAGNIDVAEVHDVECPRNALATPNLN